MYPNFRVQTILRAILKDEMLSSCKKKPEDSGGSSGATSETATTDKPTAGAAAQDIQNKQIIDMVTEAVNSITKRLNNLAHLDGTESKVRSFIS